MAIPELMGIADELGVKVSQDDPLETVVYAILDKAAESAATTESPKRKRTRIQKKDTSRVYSVNGKEGENFDVKNNRKPVEAPSLFSDMPVAPATGDEENTEEEVAETKPKKRGRKSKAELAAKAAEEAAKSAEETGNETPAEADSTETDVPEAAFDEGQDFIPEQSYESGKFNQESEDQSDLSQS